MSNPRESRQIPVSAQHTATDGPATSSPPGVEPAAAAALARREIGGPAGPEPTRYGDWEKGGRCIDF